MRIGTSSGSPVTIGSRYKPVGVSTSINYSKFFIATNWCPILFQLCTRVCVIGRLHASNLGCSVLDPSSTVIGQLGAHVVPELPTEL